MVIAIAAVAITGFLVFQAHRNVSLVKRVEQINTVCQRAYLEAILNQKIFQLRFYFNEDAELEFVGCAAVHSVENIASEQIPENKQTRLYKGLHVRACAINGKDEIARSRTRETWIFLYPEGYTQEVLLTCVVDELRLQLRLNPFTGCFEDVL